MNNSHRTAISRNKLSAPTQYLKEHNLLIGQILDYGCGRGGDADIIDADKFDPYYFPDLDYRRTYDTIICNFVLNVIKDASERTHALRSIRNLMKTDGIAYIAVRRDSACLVGNTSKGTVN